jgi:hypothetical protein
LARSLASQAGEAKQETISAAFGAKNRALLLEEYFKERVPPSPSTAWLDVYALLLWIDRTTGLAHCYESDKSQPGKNWYPRTLGFHAWLSEKLSTTPDRLADSVDWLFRRATGDLAAHLISKQDFILAKARAQRAPYEGQGYPIPGEDPELVMLIREGLSEYLSGSPSDEEWRIVVQRIRQHVTLENKRKNLVGEGFEDVIAAIIARTMGVSADVSARRLLQTVPGFENEKKGDKPNKVDVVVVQPSNGKRILVTAKWSIRADREKQFESEFSSYVAAKSDLRPFEYVVVTNEFDPARLVRACEAMATHSAMFTDVVHISTDALLAVYGESPEDSMKKVVSLVRNGRLISFEKWLEKLLG